MFLYVKVVVLSEGWKWMWSMTSWFDPNPPTPRPIQLLMVAWSFDELDSLAKSMVLILVIGLEFVRQYYTILSKSPGCVHKFYSHESVFVHNDVTVIGQQVTNFILYIRLCFLSSLKTWCVLQLLHFPLEDQELHRTASGGQQQIQDPLSEGKRSVLLILQLSEV